ncbi:unnamed protein product [Lymnaea stagnalis]|uniref:F-box domain-containing protein n=1 Tax=Lymnaea stagnalis TaxID=6523 RepID=A0AAV2HA63_LYMST
MSLLELPNEVLEYILRFLPVHSTISVSKTCRRLNEISKIDTLWQHFCLTDYQVSCKTGWDISFQDIYSKVLKNYGFFGWKRLALIPYGGLVHVCWVQGEIEIGAYVPISEIRPDDGLSCEKLFSIQWNENTANVELLCMQNRSGPKPALLIQGGKYPLLKCADNECYKNHKRKVESSKYRTNRRFTCGFKDYEHAFSNCDLHQGFNVPLLPLCFPTLADQRRSPIQLGLYAASYGPHGVEILNFMMNEANPFILEGLKISGDPNVPAGNISVEVYLDKPVILGADDQDSIEAMILADISRDEGSYQALLNSSNNNIHMRQPFSLPSGVVDRSENVPQACTARYLACGTIAGDLFTSPGKCRCHFVKFGDTFFGVLWLELFCFSAFHKVSTIPAPSRS